jgi:Ca-activated chloride channel family protein
MLKEAIEEYKKALRIDPKDDQAKENLEFAKKMLEEQKNREKENQSKEEISKEKDDQKQEKQEQKSSEEQSNKDKDEKEKDNASGKKEGKQKPEYGSEMNNSDQKKAAIENLTKKTDSNKSDHGIGKPQQGEQDVQKQQAQQMLNRLKDMPGKAMVPSYGPREVEKDW